jgi:uncharacterized protein (TIGR03437 family)
LKHITRFLLALSLGSAAALAQTPSIADGGVLNGASFATGEAVAPGSLISIFGTNLANGTANASSIPLSTQLSNVSVTFNNVPAPLLGVYAVSPNQINAQVPWEVTGSQTASVVVRNGSLVSAAASVQLTSAAPGIFAANGQAIAYGNSDAAFAAPTSFAPGSHPAKIGGDPVIILATGLGPVNPAVQTGNDVTDGATHFCASNPQITVGNTTAQFLYCVMSPQFVGVYQLGIIVAPGTPTGNAVPLQITMNGVKSNAPTIAVSN